MGEIAEKLADALSMFWQSLDERERRLLVLGVAYLGAVIVLAPLQQRQRRQEREELAEELARRLVEGRSRG